MDWIRFKLSPKGTDSLGSGDHTPLSAYRRLAMPSLSARVSTSVPADPFNLSFADIVNGIPGRFQHRNGKVLVSVSKDCRIVGCGRATTSGYTRVGMFIIQNGKARLVKECSRGTPSTGRNWMRLPSTATITL